jgi:hypothetical protein
MFNREDLWPNLKPSLPLRGCNGSLTVRAKELFARIWAYYWFQFAALNALQPFITPRTSPPKRARRGLTRRQLLVKNEVAVSLDTVPSLCDWRLTDNQLRYRCHGSGIVASCKVRCGGERQTVGRAAGQIVDVCAQSVRTPSQTYRNSGDLNYLRAYFGAGLLTM